MGKPNKRAQQCKKISKKRQTRQKREHRRQRSGVLLSLLLLLGAVGVGALELASGAVSQSWSRMAEAGWQQTAQSGFALKHIYLSGHKKVARRMVMQALDLEPGMPILAISLGEVQQRLSSLPQVRSAEITRSLPDTLHVRLIERRPVAIWQHQGQFDLLDADGVVLNQLPKVELGSYGQLPLLVGEGAQSRLPELFAMLAEEPSLVPQVEAAIWVGQRRWDIRFRRGMRVKLPAEGVLGSWKRFARMVEEYGLLTRNIAVLDMRLPDRLFMQQLKQAGAVDGAKGAHNT